MFADATLICTCVAQRPLNAIFRAISSDTAVSVEVAYSGPDVGAAGRRTRALAPAGAIGRHADDLLTDRLHDHLDPAVAGLDGRTKTQQILVHRGAQAQDPLQELLAQSPVPHIEH